MANQQRIRGYGAHRWRVWFFLLACVSTLIFSTWYHRPKPVIDLQELERDLPLIAPELWQPPLPGQPLTWRPQGAETEEGQLKAALRAIEERWPSPSLDQLILLRLAPPEGAPRAVIALESGTLYLVEQRGGIWHTERLAEGAESFAALDLTGDGRPELVASGIGGSGRFLDLQVFTWDEQGVTRAYRNEHGLGQGGVFGFLDPLADGRRDLWIDHPVSYGLFIPGAWGGPAIRDRLYYRWEGGTYQQYDQKRLATPFYHLNRYLYLASRGEWGRAAAHLERGAAIDRLVVAELGLGPFTGWRDDPFVNGRLYFAKDQRPYYADFGPTGRLERIGPGHPAREEQVGSLAL